MNVIKATKLPPIIERNLKNAPKKKHKPSFLIPADPIVFATCPLCHRDISDHDTGRRAGQLFVYMDKRQLIHSDCAKEKKLGNTTYSEAKAERKKKKKALEKKKPRRKKH